MKISNLLDKMVLSGKKGVATVLGACLLSFVLGVLVQYGASSDRNSDSERNSEDQNTEKLVAAPPMHQFIDTTPEVIVLQPATTESTTTESIIKTESSATTEKSPTDPSTSTTLKTNTSVSNVIEEIPIQPEQPEIKQEFDKWEDEPEIVEKIIDRMNRDNIRENLRYLSEKPHLASTERDEELAHYIRLKFEEAGFDSAELVPYNFMLTKPDSDNPNKITLIDNGTVIFVSKHKEQAIHENDEDPNFVHAFNAFTPAGTVTTAPGVGVVYVNYGRIEDFQMLENLGVNITGHIAIVRYGKIYRGNKIKHAEQYGALGVILFSDPEDVAAEGTEPEDVYDNSFWLPGTGMQRGSTYPGDGDPFTPGWPSTEHAYRLSLEDADLHNIPAQPIGYADARELLERLDGNDAPAAWQGGLSNLTYKLGPLFNMANRDVSLTLSTNNYLNMTKNYNVIGVIKGATEPDRYVMIGNHRDAWGYGAADPSSGTAQLLESARVFGTLLKEGWRPRRSIVFCSWGAEEYGLIGSTEWVEEHVDKLMSRAVAYINTDTCASGPALQASGSPMLWGIFQTLTKMIPGVQNSTLTLYDEWKAQQQALHPDETDLPKIKVPGGGSDYAPFLFYAGIPAIDIWFRRDESKYNITIYPAYHTGYETFYLVSQFIDPEFRIIQGCGRLASLSLKYLADSSIIPYTIKYFPEKMLKDLKESKNRVKLLEIYDKYTELESSVGRFINASSEFERKLMSVHLSEFSPLQIRSLNDQLMKIEQSFILPQGLPGRSSTRHAVSATSAFDSYASDGFPGLTDMLFDYNTLDENEKIQRDKDIRRHISDLMILTDRATSLMKDVHLI